MKMSVRTLSCFVLAAAFVVGCTEPQEAKPADDGSRARLAEKVERLNEQVVEAAAKVDRIEEVSDGRERLLAQVKEDMRKFVDQAVRQSVGRTDRRHTWGGRQAALAVAPAEAPVRIVRKPYMGFDGQSVDPGIAKELKLTAKKGVLVTTVKEGAPAAVAGVQKNDVILSLAKHAVDDFDALKTALGKCKANQAVELGIVRGDKKLTLTIRLGERIERIGG